jgi:hypothetical protein
MAECGGFFERSGYNPAQRMRLFYSVCVPVRLVFVVALIAMAWYLPATTSWIGLVLGTLAFAASLYFSVKQGCRWWRPISTVVVSAAVVAISIAYLVGGDKTVSPLLIGALLLAHLLFGVLLSIQKMPWN